MFAKKGYFVADNPDSELEGPNKFNPGGYWEPAKLVDSNVEILRAVGFEDHNTWTRNKIRPDQEKAIYTLQTRDTHAALLNLYQDNQPWVWKDPRFCYTLGYWWPLVNPETTGVLLLIRNPKEILRSFMRIKWRKDVAQDKDEFVRRINGHIDAARACIKRLDIPHIEIDYSDYSSRPTETAEKIGQFFSINLTANDLGYNEKYNHSGSSGYLEYYAEKMVSTIPESLRRFLKKITPDFLIRALLPSRTEQ